MKQVKWVKSFLSAENKCNIVENGTVCGKELGRKSTTVKDHVRAKHSATYKEITKQQSSGNDALGDLAAFIGSSTTAISTLSNRAFESLMKRIPDFKKKLPGRRTVLKKLGNVVNESIKSCVDPIIESKLPFSVSLDIATTKGMKHSYLGVIISYIDEELSINNFALDVIELHNRHTGQYLKQELCNSLEKWNLKLEDASAIVTDGASNMSKAFKSIFVESIQTQNASSDEQSESDSSEDDLSDFDFIDEQGSNLEAMEDEEYVDQSVEPTFDIFSDIPKHMKCTAHKIQLVLKDAFEKNEDMINLKKRIMKVVNKFSHSHIASSLLKHRTNKSIVLPVITRWSYLALTYARILELFDEINEICISEKWTPISEQDRNMMRDVLKLVEPFKEVTNKLQTAKDPTISMVYPAITYLIKLFEEMTGLDDVRKTLIDSLKARFDCVIDFDSSNFDAKYIISTVVDPKIAFMLTEQESKLLNIVKNANAKYAMSETKVYEDTVLETEASSLFSFAPVIKKPRRQSSTIDEQFTRYYSQVYDQAYNTSEFWFEHKKTYPHLFNLYVETIQIPATTASVERLFSFLSAHTLRYKSNSKAKLVRNRMIYSYNMI